MAFYDPLQSRAPLPSPRERHPARGGSTQETQELCQYSVACLCMRMSTQYIYIYTIIIFFYNYIYIYIFTYIFFYMGARICICIYTPSIIHVLLVADFRLPLTVCSFLRPHSDEQEAL